jgi:hypothetical protein
VAAVPPKQVEMRKMIECAAIYALTAMDLLNA